MLASLKWYIARSFNLVDPIKVKLSDLKVALTHFALWWFHYQDILDAQSKICSFYLYLLCLIFKIGISAEKCQKSTQKKLMHNNNE